MNPDAGASPGRFVLVRLGALGDVVHAMPAALALRARFPDARIDWLVDPKYVELVGLLPAVTDIVPVDTRRGPGHLLETIRQLRRRRYDAAIDLQGLIKSAFLARLAGARETIGLSRARLREPMAGFCYTRQVDPTDATHIVDVNLSVVGAVGASTARPPFELQPPRTPLAAQTADRYGASGYVLLNPGAAWPNKRWPADRFGVLAALLRQRLGLSSVILWGPGEDDQARAVVEASSGAAERLPATSIVDVCALARGAAVVVSGDTGPLHLAAAVGAPVVGIFGPTRAERNGPWSAHDEVVSRTDRCVCPYERRCRRVAGGLPGEWCLLDLGVEEVAAAVARRLALKRHG